MLLKAESALLELNICLNSCYHTDFERATTLQTIRAGVI